MFNASNFVILADSKEYYEPISKFFVDRIIFKNMFAFLKFVKILSNKKEYFCNNLINIIYCTGLTTIRFVQMIEKVSTS